MVAFLWLCSFKNSSAQIPNAPKNLEFFEGYGFRFSTTQYGSFYWQNVPNATGYRIDVANDSLFTDILPGLHNIPIIRHRIGIHSFPPRWIPGTTTATIFGLSHSSLYYCRVRAENSAGTSENSTTLTIKTAPVSCIVIEPMVVSDSSISLRWRDAKKFRYGDDSGTNSLCPTNSNATFSVRYEPFFQDSFCIGTFAPYFTNTANTLSVQGSSITLKNLNANTRYAVGLSLPPNGTGRICNITTLPRQFSQYGRIISFYEGPLAHRSPRDTSAYYSRNDTNTTLEKALSLVEQVRSMGIAVDTLWFHPPATFPLLTGAPIITTGDPERDYILFLGHPCGFTIKLRQKDDRLAALGFTNRVGFWQYADNLMFYRYIFSGTTSVSMPFALNTPIAIAPNPTSDQTTMYYTLPSPSTVTIEVYDLLGHRLYNNTLGYQNAGTHTTPLDLHHLSNGMYRVYLRMSNGTAPAQTATQAITILK